MGGFELGLVGKPQTIDFSLGLIITIMIITLKTENNIVSLILFTEQWNQHHFLQVPGNLQDIHQAQANSTRCDRVLHSPES